MAGQLTIDTLKASTGVLATQNGMTGIAKAWVNFNGNTAAINSSFNISSVTRNGTGDYTITFTTAMPNANYPMGFTLGNGTSQSGGTAWTITLYSTATTTTSSVRVNSGYASSVGFGLFDANPITIAFFSS